MLKYFSEDPDYKAQFSEVSLWKQWAHLRTEFDGTDIGVDLVAKKHDGGFCAIQCKCYAPDTRISMRDLDSFLSTASLPLFADNARILINDASSQLHRINTTTGSDSVTKSSNNSIHLDRKTLGQARQMTLFFDCIHSDWEQIEMHIFTTSHAMLVLRMQGKWYRIILTLFPSLQETLASLQMRQHLNIHHTLNGMLISRKS